MSEKIIAPQAKGYSDAGASTSKRALKGFIAQSGAPVEDIDFNNATLRQRGRMLYMASPVASAAINTSRTKCVGSGLHMKSVVKNDILGLPEDYIKEWQANVEAEWEMWCENKRNCDALGLNNFYELQQVALKSWLMSGDVFALIKRSKPTPLNPYSMRLHLIEADRVSTPFDAEKAPSMYLTEGENKENGNLIHDGVEVSKDGMVEAYHICNVYPKQITGATPKWTRVQAVGEQSGIPNVLHVMSAERPEQYRGVTILAPIIEVLLQLRRYTESELVAALIQSYLTAWITTAAETTDFPLNEVGAGNIDGIPSEQPNEVSTSENEYEMGPGTINHLAPGETVTLGNPNIPTAGFDNFVKAICRMAGASIEIPYDVLMKEFNSSYSAAKGALEEAWETIKMERSWFVTDFCQPIYKAWLAEAVAIGRIKAPGFFENPLIREAWSASRWDGPAQTHLDPVKEANANQILVARGWKTNEQVTRESYGGDWNDNAEVVMREMEKFPGATEQTTITRGDDDDEE